MDTRERESRVGCYSSTRTKTKRRDSQATLISPSHSTDSIRHCPRDVSSASSCDDVDWTSPTTRKPPTEPALIGFHSIHEDCDHAETDETSFATPAHTACDNKDEATFLRHRPSVVTNSSFCPPSMATSNGPLSSCRSVCRRLHLCWLAHPYRYAEPELELLYLQYHMPLHLLRAGLVAWLILIIRLGLQTLVWTSRPGPSKFLETSVQRLSFINDVVVYGICVVILNLSIVLFHKAIFRKLWDLNLNIQYAVSGVLIFVLFIDCFAITHHAAMQPRTPTTALWYVMVVVLVINSTLTIRYLFNLVVSIVLATTWMIYATVVAETREFTSQQIGVSILLLFMSITTGLSHRLLFERVIRKLFYDSTRHIEQKFRLIAETRQQKSLLLSIFPDAVADQMTREIFQDLQEHFSKNGDSEQDLPFLVPSKMETQFYRSIMDRCENVSILWADIVSFTETSSTMSPQELVAMLNDVFARFDIMAHEEGCDRIKILGDGYVCVAGVPHYCIDHADRCVRTGSRLVKEIGHVGSRHGKSLQLRVGVHSGAVLCGVLGLRKWSFDVWGNDVNKATLMESTGKPGHVHISHSTHECLRRSGHYADYIIEEGERVVYNSEDLDTAYAMLNLSPPEAAAATVSQDEQIQRERQPSCQHPFYDFQPPSFVPVHDPLTVDVSIMSAGGTDPLNGSNRLQPSVMPNDVTWVSQSQVSPDTEQCSVSAANNINVDDTNALQAPKHVTRFCPSVSRDLALQDFASELNVHYHITMALVYIKPHSLKFKDKSIEKCYNATPDTTFEWHIVIYALIILVCTTATRLAVATSLVVRVAGWAALLPAFFVVIILLLRIKSARVRKQVDPYISRIRASPRARMVITLLAFGVLHSTVDLGLFPCRQYSMMARTVHLDNCTSLANATSAVCTLLNLDQVTVSKNHCQYLISPTTESPSTTSPPKVSSPLRISSTSHSLASSSSPIARALTSANFPQTCNISSDIQRIPSPARPRANRCSFPHLVRYSEMLALIGMMIMIRMRYVHIMMCLIFCGSCSVILSLTFYRLPYTDSYFYWLEITEKPDYPPEFIHTSIFLAIVALFTVLVHSRATEVMVRISYLREYANEDTIEQNRQLGQANIYLLHNILPKHVAKHFLSPRTKELYSRYHLSVAVMFCSIPNFVETFYSESSSNRHGIECLRLLNEIFADWDKLLSKPAYSGVEKIKTIGPTYMLAAGLDKPDAQCRPADMLADYARSMFDVISEINTHAFQNFKLRIGLHVGPVVSGVIGAKKPLFDIWGDTVNFASRMDSTGVNGKVQVTDDTAAILQHCGYELERRGEVFVKGKGQVVTHFISQWPQRNTTAQTTVTPSPSPVANGRSLQSTLTNLSSVEA